MFAGYIALLRSAYRFWNSRTINMLLLRSKAGASSMLLPFKWFPGYFIQTNTTLKRGVNEIA